jgi:hypothetical protein
MSSLELENHSLKQKIQELEVAIKGWEVQKKPLLFLPLIKSIFLCKN